MVKIIVSSNADKTLDRLRKMSSKLKKKTDATTYQTALIARDIIKLYMPKATGQSADSIITLKEMNTKDSSTSVVTQAFIPHKARMARSPKWSEFNLPLWMMTSRRALGHFRTGNIPKLQNIDKDIEKIYKKKLDIALATAIQ